ncbi:GGDEF domain-containing protein [Pseudomaricurvus alkylphenolicus]|uniref:GGDEF domain-containing protein n=1 Tax=Pseudomaricurvus alkylphenolicus TaxID=1306991 RepID=UPI0014222C18|nr:GGDEF domain-containing protein [Pseudomaricurvus alkylphenolicus]NIB39376.1 GGDEF domain-containing protein [Pseudomaricurvus alkylphenolicus]
MANQQDIHLSETHLNAAIAHMQSLGIPTSPANIRVWYDYSEGENEDLNLAIDELRSASISFDPDLNYELYNRFYGELPNEQLEKFRAQLRSITTELGLELTGLNPDSGECESALAIAEKALADGCELDALKTITQQLIAESRKVVEQNNQMGQIVKSMQSKMSSLEVNLERASTEALTDKLTGIANRRAYDKKLDDVLMRLKPQSQTSLLMIDIDHFKRFNDTHGHLMGDKVLRFVAQMIKKVIKGDDFLARTGGEEFQLILEDCPLDDAVNIAEKIRQTIGSAHLTKGKERTPVGHVTLSIGVAHLSTEETRNDLINRVDKYLYEAKAKGRNRVVSNLETASA